jgi:hypothetical protein
VDDASSQKNPVISDRKWALSSNGARKERKGIFMKHVSLECFHMEREGKAK